MKRKIFGFLAVIIGILWIASVYGWIDTQWINSIELRKIWLPALIIFVGLNFIFSHGCHSSHRHKLKDDVRNNDEPRQKCEVLCSSKNMQYNGQIFSGTEVDVALGSVVVDLHGSDIQNGSTIFANSLMGEVTIIVPENIGVEISSQCLFGEVKDKRRNTITSADKVIRIYASCMMGGVTVKN